MKFLKPSKEQQEKLLKAIEDLPDGPQKRFFKEKERAEGEAVKDPYRIETYCGSLDCRSTKPHYLRSE